MSKKHIGRTDKFDFLDFSIENIDVKMDTGAYTSSIRCLNVEEKTINGKRIIEFKLLDESHPEYADKVFQTSNYAKRLVKNSFGQSEKRYVIQTTVVIFGEIHLIYLTLSERKNLKYPILIGRRFLSGKFIVDVDATNVSYKEKNKLKSKINK